MNRIVLIGNGFDLAHNIKSSYSNFIEDFWENAIIELKKQPQRSQFSNDLFKITQIPFYWTVENTYEGLIKSLKESRSFITYKNAFLKLITEKKGIQNWVDIENEYYDLLKLSFKNPKSNYNISELNKDFKEITALLEKYLTKIETDFFKNFNDQNLKSEIGHKIYDVFNLKDFTESSINEKVDLEYNKIKGDIEGLYEGHINIQELEEDKQKLINRLGKNEHKKEIRKILLNDGASNYFDLKPKSILFLNFNYTSTEKLYANHNDFDSFHTYKSLTKENIHIHGLLNSKNNPIIFGFGDEIDGDYQEIENLNNNEYLENIKSIKYLETDNYKKMLEFLNSGGFQICVLGHSCGISDRTLLSTLFGHKNCHSIKLYYHQKDKDIENYSDIIRNISRNFNDKSLMREKVVNKEYCQPLKKYL